MSKIGVALLKGEGLGFNVEAQMTRVSGTLQGLGFRGLGIRF